MKSAALRDILRHLVRACLCGAAGSALMGCYEPVTWTAKMPEDPGALGPLGKVKMGEWIAEPSTCGLLCGGKFTEACRIARPDEPTRHGGDHLECKMSRSAPSDPDGAQVLQGSACAALCDGMAESCFVQRPKAGRPPIIECRLPPAIGGRRPAGLAERRSASLASGTAGAYFAELARLEAASVVAFRRLGDELRAWGAPARLTRAATRARRDEVRHARVA